MTDIYIDLCKSGTLLVACDADTIVEAPGTYTATYTSTYTGTCPNIVKDI